jgi:uncharacterized protein (TIGR03435 family)
VHDSLAGNKASLAMIQLGRDLHRPVIDRTGIEGEFEFKVDYAVGDHPGSGGLSARRHSGAARLKLEPAKGPIETLIVDRAEKPSAN